MKICASSFDQLENLGLDSLESGFESLNGDNLDDTRNEKADEERHRSAVASEVLQVSRLVFANLHRSENAVTQDDDEQGYMPEGVKNMARHECITCLKTCSKCNILEVFANALRVQRVSGFDGVEESLEEVKVTFVEKHRVADVVARRERKLLLLFEGKAYFKYTHP